MRAFGTMQPLMRRGSLTRRGLMAGVSAGALASPSFVRAQASTGVALVIGNSKYKWEASLPNVKRDAPDVARAFQSLGLRTELVQDAGLAEMLAAIEKFKTAAQGAPLAAFYFAGHGASWDKDTYLVPQDADLADPGSVSKLIRIEAIKEATRGAARRLLVMDNCRNNPAGGWRQLSTALAAKVDASELAAAILNDPDTIVIYSTASGRIALDGPPGANSPFAAAFLRQLGAGSVELRTLPEKLRRELLIATEGRQLIYDFNTFTAPFALKSNGKAPAVAAPAYDPARLVELGNAYAFARDKGLILPPGLVAIRPPAGAPHAEKVGAYAFSWSQTIKGSRHLEPVVYVVLAVRGDRAEVANASKTYDYYQGSRWTSGVVNVAENRANWISANQLYRLELKWKDANSGTYSSTLISGSGFLGETQPFKRLDG